MTVDAPRRPVPVDTGEVDPPDSEEALVARARAGDRGAWDRLYQSHFDRVFRRMMYLVRDAGLAEDLVQETFAQALLALPKFAGRSAFSTWLHGIGTNVVRRYWRKTERGRRARATLRERALTPVARREAADDPEAAHLTRERAAVLDAVLDELPHHLREAFILVDVHHLPTAEVATQLGISKSNVSVRAHRARVKIRRRLVALGWLES